MQTIYLRFGDRAAALAALAAGLGYAPAIDSEGGETWPCTGFAAGTRFDLVFMGEIRAPTGETIDTPFGPFPVTAPLRLAAGLSDVGAACIELIPIIVT